MTAIATPVSGQTRKIPVTHIVNIVLGILIAFGFLVLPWINQPELGPTSAQIISTERSANEFGIPRDGLSLIPMAGIAAIILSIIGILAQNYTRIISLLTGVAGLVGLVYFVSFAGAFQTDLDSSVLGVMGLGFWFSIVGVLGLIIQALIPKPAAPAYAVTKVLGNQESILALAFIGLIIIIGVANPRFVADRNMLDILSGNAYIAVAAIGMSMVIISGNIDISVGSLIGVLAAVSGTVVVSGLPIWLSWVAPLIVGGAIGALIGFLVAYLRIPSIIVTLGMMSILKGGLIMVLGGAWITDMPEGYALAQMRPLGIPMPIIFMVGLTILATLWMRYNPMGRSIYAVGGNAEAARLSGISEKRTVLMAFVLNGVFAGVASVLYATQLSVIQTTVPPNLELLIITASVVGGVSILGGTGTIIGSSLAAVLLNTIRSAMVFINVSPFWLQAVQGVLILVTVLVDILRRRRQRL